MDRLKPPIFIVGNVRSGTSMTLKTLALADDIVAWREPRTIWTLGNAERTDDRFTAEMATPRIVKRIRKAFLHYQTENGGRRIVEKTPSNVLRMPFIRAVFPEGKILHLYRDGRDNVSSALPKWSRPIVKGRLRKRLKLTPKREWIWYLPRYLRDRVGIRLGVTRRVKSWGVVYPGMYDDLKSMELIEVVAWQWVHGIETARADLALQEAQIATEARYEDLVNHPYQEFCRLLDFFDCQINKAIENRLNAEIRQNAVNVYKTRLSPDQIRKILPILRPTMEHLGYQIEETVPQWAC